MQGIKLCRIKIRLMFFVFIILFSLIIILGCTTKTSEPLSKTQTTAQSETKKLPQDPTLLNGLWKIETAYMWVNPPGVWKEDKETATRIPYQEFKDGKMCSMWAMRKVPELNTLEEALDNFYCVEYKPYKVNGSIIIFAGENYGYVYKWKIEENKLIIDYNTPGRGIYIKIFGTREKPADTENPKITSFTTSSASVTVGSQVTLTCDATDYWSICELSISVSSPQSNAFQGGTGFLQSGTRIFTYTVPTAGMYTATCKVMDCGKNEVNSILTFSAI